MHIKTNTDSLMPPFNFWTDTLPTGNSPITIFLNSKGTKLEKKLKTFKMALVYVR